MVRQFYARDADGIPREWVAMVLNAWASLGPKVTSARMVRDYTTALYEPAAASSLHLAGDGGKPAIELANWRRRVADAWDDVAVTSVDIDVTDASAGAALAGAGEASTSAGCPRTTSSSRSSTARSATTASSDATW